MLLSKPLWSSLLHLVMQLNWSYISTKAQEQITQRTNAKIMTENLPRQLRPLLVQQCAISNNEVEMIKIKIPSFKCNSIFSKYFLRSGCHFICV